jgi:alkylation response protein AidB-like acyl-CoA dehydrogenase
VDGDHLVVNGSKIWTSYAHQADFQELLVRTGPQDARHRTITWTINDMRFPGIEVRPIKALDGHYHNCEVFYDDVHIPLSNVVGEINGGWSVAMTTLQFERGSAMFSGICQSAVELEDLIEYARTHVDPRSGRTPIEDEALAEKLGTLRAQMQSIRALMSLLVDANERKFDLGDEATILFLPFSELMQAILRTALEILGPQNLARSTANWIERYLGAFPITIAGGSSEIQRNIIGERLLHLPRLPRGH